MAAAQNITHKDSGSSIVEEVIRKYGGPKGVQERFNYKSIEAVYMWRIRGELPKSKLIDIHFDTGIPLSKLNKTTG